jgi:anti-anti-sigma factor
VLNVSTLGENADAGDEDAPPPTTVDAGGGGGVPPRADGGAVARPFVLPPRLVHETRAECREAIFAFADRVLHAAGSAPLRISLDLTSTTEVDASGLGVLVAVQKHVTERGGVVVLSGAPEPLRRLLVLTKLDQLFQLRD